MCPMVSSQGMYDQDQSGKLVSTKQGENWTTCDPWTSRDFTDEMRNAKAQCHHCLSDCDHVTYLPTVTSAEFRLSTIIP